MCRRPHANWYTPITVAKVVWPGTALRRARPQPRFAHEAERRQMEVAVEDPRARRGEEERVGARLRAELVPALGIGAQRFDGALMQRNLAGLAELRVTDDKETIVEVDVTAIEPEGLADAHPGRVEEADHGRGRL